jgi:hypothetical protein
MCRQFRGPHSRVDRDGQHTAADVLRPGVFGRQRSDELGPADDGQSTPRGRAKAQVVEKT